MKKKVIIIILLICAIAWAQEKPYRLLNSFSAGELSELLNPREDLNKYHSGCSVMENMIPLPQGAAQKRPGTIYVAESKENTKIRLIPFEYSTEQSYIIELGNQYMRFYTSNARITTSIGSEDLSAIGSIVAHWKLNDNLATTAVIDANGATHDGVLANSINSSTLHRIGKAGTGCFDFDNQYAVEVNDADTLSFDDTADKPFSIVAWVYVEPKGSNQTILGKWEADVREWVFRLGTNNALNFWVLEEGDDDEAYRKADAAVAIGWHQVAVVYDNADPNWSGATAANFMTFYVDGNSVASTATNDAGYAGMANSAIKVTIGASYDSDSVLEYFFKGRLDNVALFSKALSAAEISTLYDASTVTTYELETPYLTADLFELKMEQSADILYITHPDYETRKLSRYGNDDWLLEAIAIENGPFRDQNTDTTGMIGSSATTETVTLTATACAPFITDTAAGHLPSGSTTTSKSQTGTLFKLVHPLATLEYNTQLEQQYSDNPAENVSWLDCGTVYKGTTWYLTTIGDWTGTLEIQRNYAIGAAHDASGWETVLAFASIDDRNVDTSSTEEGGNASYRAILTNDGGTEVLKVYFRTNATEHVGIVKITSVASSISATGTVLTTLGSTDATYKWSEGAWSNYRGWPRTVTFFEDRLTFGGNKSQPDTIWASVTADYENMLEGADDDDALLFTLSSRLVNVINWLIGKDKILIGTSGAEWTLSGSSDEPLTPSNIKAEQQSTYGSANMQATLASESVLFFQRGAEKMRELAYNWELDSYVAPDMTILNPEVTGDGITDTAFQQTPNPILWCIKENGDIATFVYERKELITSWSRQITDGDFESAAVIHGDPEDEVWVSVKRAIDGNDKRYIEYFSTVDFGTDPCDAFYIDCGATYATDVNVISDLTWLEGESVVALADGTVISDFTVASDTVTLGGVYQQVQIGLPYTVQMRTMPLSWIAQGMTIQGRIKRINEVIARYKSSGDFYVGRDVTDKELISISSMALDEQGITMPAGYDPPGYVFIYQESSEPLTLLALMLTFQVY